ncbi:hypothetical protein CBM2631_A90343 [Cupriavidus taiwanensis]|nr:hypothetical protein CBM2631_A90343 [Cupriavidus taiwanensis]
MAFPRSFVSGKLVAELIYAFLPYSVGGRLR